MDGEFFDGLINKKIFLKLINGRNYQAVVQAIKEDLILIKDKYGNPVWINIKEISFCEVQQ